MQYLSAISEDSDERLNAINRVLDKANEWTEEDLAIFHRAESRGRVETLYQMLAMELADEMPELYHGHTHYVGGLPGWLPRQKLSRAQCRMSAR